MYIVTSPMINSHYNNIIPTAFKWYLYICYSLPINVSNYISKCNSNIMVKYKALIVKPRLPPPSYCSWNISICYFILVTVNYKMHLNRQWNCWSLRCSLSIACRRCSNYIFIPLTHGFIGLGKAICKTRRETLKHGDLVLLIWEILRCMICKGEVRIIPIHGISS